MPTQPNKGPKESTSRAEKLSLLSTMLGPDAMARVREGTARSSPDLTAKQEEVEPGRAAWHRNRLLERLRQQVGDATASKTATSSGRLPSASKTPVTDTKQTIDARNLRLDARLAQISDTANLGQEHPAIIARLIKALSRDERVDALKSLPGPVARSVVRRLK